MNVMLVCPVGNIFLGSIDTTGNKKNKVYIAGQIKEYVRQVGPMNVVQLCSDNASAMLEALDMVIANYPNPTSQVVQLTSLTSSWKIGKGGNVQGPDSHGEASMQLHPEPSRDHSIVPAIHPEVVPTFACGDKVCVSVLND